MGPRQEDPRGQRTHDVDVTLKYSSSLQSSGFLRLRLRQTAEPLTFVLFSLTTAPHPNGHILQRVLASVSCGWYQPAGQSWHLFIPRDKANFPLEQAVQDVDPKKLVSPPGHGSHLRRPLSSSMPLVPSGHGEDSTHAPSPAEHFVACQAGGTGIQ